MVSDAEQVRWARVLQALWLVASATAKVRGGAYHTLLIPGVIDSAKALLSRKGICALLACLYSIRHESPRRGQAIDALLETADAKVRWFIEADPRTLPLAGSGSLTSGAELMNELARLPLNGGLTKHVAALADTFAVLSRIEPYSPGEAAEITRMRREAAAQPFNLGLRGELFDQESR